MQHHTLSGMYYLPSLSELICRSGSGQQISQVLYTLNVLSFITHHFQRLLWFVKLVLLNKSLTWCSLVPGVSLRHWASSWVKRRVMLSTWACNWRYSSYSALKSALQFCLWSRDTSGEYFLQPNINMIHILSTQFKKGQNLYKTTRSVENNNNKKKAYITQSGISSLDEDSVDWTDFSLSKQTNKQTRMNS